MGLFDKYLLDKDESIIKKKYTSTGNIARGSILFSIMDEAAYKSVIAV